MPAPFVAKWVSQPRSIKRIKTGARPFLMAWAPKASITGRSLPAQRGLWRRIRQWCCSISGGNGRGVASGETASRSIRPCSAARKSGRTCNAARSNIGNGILLTDCGSPEFFGFRHLLRASRFSAPPGLAVGRCKRPRCRLMDDEIKGKCFVLKLPNS